MQAEPLEGKARILSYSPGVTPFLLLAALLDGWCFFKPRVL